MRVTVVTTWFPTSLAPSSGSFVVRDARAMATLGNDVEVVHLVPAHQDDGTRHVYHEGLKVLRLPMTPSRPDQIAAAAAALPQILAGSDIVHTTAISSLLPFVVARPRAPWVHTEHYSGLTSPENLPFATRAVLPMVRRLLQRPDVVTAVCEFLATPIRAVRGEKETVIVPCIVPPLHPPVPRPEATEDIRLVSVGGLVERKDPLIAVDTVAELVRRGQGATLTLVGDGPLREQIEARAEEAGVADRRPRGRRPLLRPHPRRQLLRFLRRGHRGRPARGGRLHRRSGGVRRPGGRRPRRHAGRRGVRGRHP
jgi:glycosyltransferase involved in cell wall biosynthesis